MGFKGRFGWKQAWMGFCALMFILGSLILVNPGEVYVSPDETANGFFARQFAQTGELKGTGDTLAESFDRLHPRSTLVHEGRLVPNSFLGLPTLYGAITAVLGDWVLWILTPLMTLLAAWGVYDLTKKFINAHAASLAFVLMLLHPAIWYYSARGLMHNVLFLDLLVIAAWLWVVSPIKRGEGASMWNQAIAGLAIGLALFVRTSEVIWVGAAILMAGVIWWKSITWNHVRAGAIGLLVGLGLMGIMNAWTYGHPLTTGYTIGAPVITELVQGETTDAIELLPFGLHLHNAWEHFVAYGAGMFWWLSLLTLLGIFVLLRQETHKRTMIWGLTLATAVSVWLVLMYGSWEIHDNPDPTQITMANSYVRYWLPMYVMSAPLIGAFIDWVAKHGKNTFARGLLTAVILMPVLGMNVYATFLQGQDGLLNMREELAQTQQIQEAVLRYTEAESVIIVDRADKIIFPHRQVWYPLRDEATYEAMPVLLEQTSLYYYGITFPESDLTYLNTSRLERMGLQIEPIETFDIETLYRIYRP